jgi:N-methylhydantoinase A
MGVSPREAALSVLEIANESMVDAIRLRTVEVGVDPRRHCLVAFGGAGPLHAAAIARRLGIRQVVVPPRAGLGSAIGALTADLRSDRVATVHARSDRLAPDELDARVRAMRERALEDVGAYGAAVHTRARLRYAGQNYEHEVELGGEEISRASLHDAVARFERLHHEFYGYDLSGEVVELVDLIVTATVPSKVEPPAAARTGPPGGATTGAARREVHFAGGPADTPIVRREALVSGDRLDGPLIVEDPDTTTLIESRDRLGVAGDGSLIIDVDPEGGA